MGFTPGDAMGKTTPPPVHEATPAASTSAGTRTEPLSFELRQGASSCAALSSVLWLKRSSALTGRTGLGIPALRKATPAQAPSFVPLPVGLQPPPPVAEDLATYRSRTQDKFQSSRLQGILNAVRRTGRELAARHGGEGDQGSGNVMWMEEEPERVAAPTQHSLAYDSGTSSTVIDQDDEEELQEVGRAEAVRKWFALDVSPALPVRC